MSTRPTIDDTRLKAVLARLHEVGDDAAGPEARAVLAAAPGVLRVPFAGGFFRFIAADPPLLASLWAAVEKPLGTRFLEREADRLRSHALFVVPGFDQGAAQRAHLLKAGIDERTLGQLNRVNETVHYVLPKYLIVAAAAALSLRGESVGGHPGGRPDDLEPTRGPAAGAESLTAPALGELRPEMAKAAQAVADLHGHPLVAGYYRVLAAFPPYLERILVDLRSIVGTPRYLAAAATLATLAEVAARGLPQPVKVEATGALSREDAALLFAFFHQQLLPDLLIDVTYLRALLENERRARTNALSATAG